MSVIESAKSRFIHRSVRGQPMPRGAGDRGRNAEVRCGK
jgi:hypothetical protein